MSLTTRQAGKSLPPSRRLLSHLATEETDFGGLLISIRPFQWEAMANHVGKKSANNLMKVEDIALNLVRKVLASMST